MRKVLLIEDNIDLIETTADILELSNYKVYTAKDGKEGIILAKKELPDIIICDIMMPVLDGFGVLHMLRRDSATASIPFIFLTAKTERSAIRKGMNMGADDYLTKPFEEIELLDAIESRLHKNDQIKNEVAASIKQTELPVAENVQQITLAKFLEERPLFNYEKRSYVFTEGHIANKLYFIKEGRVKAYKLSASGKELITGFYGSGDFLGLTSLLGDSNVYNETIEVVEDAVIGTISKEKIVELLANNNISTSFIKLVSNNFLELEEKLTQLAYDTVRQRITKTLLDLYDKETEEHKVLNKIVISREDLANLIGVASETLIRGLSQLKKENIIELDKKGIVLLDVNQLKKICVSSYL